MRCGAVLARGGCVEWMGCCCCTPGCAREACWGQAMVSFNFSAWRDWRRESPGLGPRRGKTFWDVLTQHGAGKGDEVTRSGARTV